MFGIIAFSKINKISMATLQNIRISFDLTYTNISFAKKDLANSFVYDNIATILYFHNKILFFLAKLECLFFVFKNEIKSIYSLIP